MSVAGPECQFVQAGAIPQSLADSGSERTFVLVSGPSSVGKSTYINYLKRTSRFADADVALGLEHCKDFSKFSKDTLFHFNVLRPLCNTDSPEALINSGFGCRFEDYERDAALGPIFSYPGKVRAVVLVACKSDLLMRASSRQVIEQAFTEQYDAALWCRKIGAANLESTYLAWLDFLEARGIAYDIVDASTPEYKAIASRAGLIECLKKSAVTAEVIQSILNRVDFEYHRVDLPFGLSTRAQDRSTEIDKIFPIPLAGKAVLDVGCALGYHSFVAEQRGASKVVALDVKPKRLEQALLLKELKQSRVEFCFRDIYRQPVTEQFDVVLLLNVIHHLTDPQSVIAQLSRATRQLMVIEFPTFKDPKFSQFHPWNRWFLPALIDRLPLVGVSSMASGIDQTFIFSPVALERVLKDHQQLFSRVEFKRSDMDGRMVAHCWK